MKTKILLLAALLSTAAKLFAQNAMATLAGNLPEVRISGNISLHFLSPEPIAYVDISAAGIAGDLPVKNILRIKIMPDSLRHFSNNQRIAVVTVVGQSFIAQYQLRLDAFPGASDICTQINILPEQMRPVDISGVGLTTSQLKAKALAMIADHHYNVIRKAKAYGIQAKLIHIGTVGDFVFLDLRFDNATHLAYNMDELRFKIEDKKIGKATNAQSIELPPLWQLYPSADFKKNYRNVYVLKKAIFPENKVLNIALTEKQISGREITLPVKYGDILKADTF
ncbi:conjugative transposon protein TraN [Mucilaginibacter sabulilitoris]|uniref:Conjugative transposon protein TraN n=1 Tax=Mucilaginibacter sabulilitoris TaxID=1173583 RepID=A0ABZ0TS36_9SPHI|nr:conjugative transposon protein TraN [Mucilaginibacter sabulilitoris]WPU95776.1 conjugative transposon protein TraN [Mucilaginibacter sabulilitoris]